MCHSWWVVYIQSLRKEIMRENLTLPVTRIFTCSLNIEKKKKKRFLSSKSFFLSLKFAFFTYNPDFSHSGKRRHLLKYCGKKEKMLVSSIFSFSHNIFDPINLHFSNIYVVVWKPFKLVHSKSQ